MKRRLAIVLLLVVMPAAAAVTPRRKPTPTPTPHTPSAYARMLEKEAADYAAYSAADIKHDEAVLVHIRCLGAKHLFDLKVELGQPITDKEREAHEWSTGVECFQASLTSDPRIVNELKAVWQADVFWLTSHDPPKGVKAYQPRP